MAGSFAFRRRAGDLRRSGSLHLARLVSRQSGARQGGTDLELCCRTCIWPVEGDRGWAVAADASGKTDEYSRSGFPSPMESERCSGRVCRVDVDGNCLGADGCGLQGSAAVEVGGQIVGDADKRRGGPGHVPAVVPFEAESRTVPPPRDSGVVVAEPGHVATDDGERGQVRVEVLGLAGGLPECRRRAGLR